MRKITMKRKGRTSEITKNTTEPEDDNIEAKQDDEESNANNTSTDSVQEKENGTPSPKKSKSRKSKVESDKEESDVPEKQPIKKKSKKGRKSKAAKVEESNGTEENSVEEDEETYEVEEVIDMRTAKGSKQYLIRWKGYGEESDTWEPESTLDCPDLITKFLNSRKSSDKKGKKRSSLSNNKSPKKARNEQNDDVSDGEEKVGEYEVDRILEVHFKKNGKREFLVHWKGYNATDNTWEPEENMSCHDLIEKFMAKVDKARLSDARELRVNRKPTQHFTLSMQSTGRRLSRRNMGKQRTHYQEFD